MTLDDLRKRELWVIASPDGQVDTVVERFLFLSEDEARHELARYYDPDGEDCDVIKLGRIAAEPARMADAEATS